MDKSEDEMKIFECALAGWDKNFLNEQIENGDVILITSEEESADRRIYDDTPTISFYEEKSNEKIELDLVIQAINFKIKKGTKELEFYLSKLNELNALFSKADYTTYSYIAYEKAINDSEPVYSIFIQKATNSNCVIVSIRYTPNYSVDSEDSYILTLIAEPLTGNEITLFDIFEALGHIDIADHYQSFEENTKELIKEESYN